MKQDAVKRSVPLFVSVLALAGIAFDASAASVIDTAMHTSLSSGFTDLMDTIKDVIATSWPVVIGGAVLMAAPNLVNKLIHKATGR